MEHEDHEQKDKINKLNITNLFFDGTVGAEIECIKYFENLKEMENKASDY